jgi:hypothetical protein
MSKIELRNPFQRVIGLIGYAGSGKDEVARQLGLPGAGFADELKAICRPLAQVFGLDLGKREDKEKFREVLVAVGRLGRSIDPDFWVKRLDLPDAPTVAIRDVRYLNECLAIQEVGGTLAYVNRPNTAPANEEERRTIDEIFQAAAQTEQIDMVEIVNDGDLNTLKINAAAALDYPLHTKEPEYVAQGTPQDFEFAPHERYDATDAAWDAKLAEEDTGCGHPDCSVCGTDYSDGPASGSFEEIFGGPVTEEPHVVGGCPICGLDNCDLDAKPLPYVARIEPTAFTVDPDRDWVEYKIETHPLFQVGVIDGEDAIPFLMSLNGDFGGVVIFRGRVPEGFDFDRGETVVLLPEREPVTFRGVPIEWSPRLDAFQQTPQYEQIVGVDPAAPEGDYTAIVSFGPIPQYEEIEADDFSQYIDAYYTFTCLQPRRSGYIIVDEVEVIEPTRFRRAARNFCYAIGQGLDAVSDYLDTLFQY